MIYKQFDPHAALKEYIDAFWIVTGNGNKPVTEKIMPDGCVDIIFNLGEDCKADQGSFTMQNGKAYLVGTMTRFKETTMDPGTKLLGIRFKPAAFSAFYKFSSLHEVTDRTVEFEKSFSPDLQMTIRESSAYLNRFFLNRLSKPRHNLLTIIADIQEHKGQSAPNMLARTHCTTLRQLERSFRQHIGVSPKEFINFVRYQSALPIIRNRTSGKNLSDIAFECGYYDHSHLTNEVKRYTGSVPSQL